MNDSVPLSPKVYRSMLISSAFGAGIIILPRFLCECTRQDAWLTSLFSGFILILSALLSGMSPRISDLSNGFVKNVLSFLFCGYYLLTASLSLALLCEIVNAYLLTRTPFPVVLFCFCLLIAYAVAGKLTLVSRFTELTQVLLPISILLLLPTLLFVKKTNLDPMFCQPFLSQLKGISRSLFPFSFSTLSMVLPSPKGCSRLKLSLVSAATVSGLFFIITGLCVGVFGEGMCRHYLYPVIMLYKAIPVPIIDRLDLFFLILWLILSIRPCMNLTMAATLSIMNIRFPFSCRQKPLAIVFSVLLFSLAAFFFLTDSSVFMSRILCFVYLFFGILIPGSLRIFHRKGGNRECFEKC